MHFVAAENFNCDSQLRHLHWCKNSVLCFYILEIYLKGTENSICLHFHQEFLTDIFGGKWQLISQAIFLSIGDNFIYTNCREDPVTPWQYASARGQQGVTTQNLQQSEDEAKVLSVDFILFLMHSAQLKSLSLTIDYHLMQYFAVMIIKTSTWTRNSNNNSIQGSHSIISFSLWTVVVLYGFITSYL